jgi:hypothetical protein
MVCNVCGKWFKRQDFGHGNSDTHRVRFDGFYGSSFPQDTETLLGTVCSGCLEKWVKSWALPPEGKSWVTIPLQGLPELQDLPEGPKLDGDEE